MNTLRAVWGCCLLAAAALGTACSGPVEDRPIGTALMRQDGSIVLRLRAEADDGTVGEFYETLAPGDPEHARLVEHLGGLEAGQSKSVPPWPDEPK